MAMECFVIEGGKRLSGEVRIEGAKNAALPLLCCSLLTDDTVQLDNVSDHADIDNMLKLLGELGMGVERTPGRIRVTGTGNDTSEASYETVKKMRASISVLGPLVAKRGKAFVSLPGGCAFGDRPVDLHLRGLRALGAKIEMEGGYITVSADRLTGATIFLGGPNGSSVGATENVMCAATLAKGRTVIEGAACEPEVVDVARLLRSMGAKITGDGSPRIVIEGVDELSGASHSVMPDRIVAGTYAIAAAMTNGQVVLHDFPYDSLLCALDRWNEIGVRIEKLNAADSDERCSVRVFSERFLRPTTITTQPHPGFPTDLQAQFMALLTQAQGNSIITEKIYTERFLHVAELARMGAQVQRNQNVCVITGRSPLSGAEVMASDLRASACLVLAGLAAEGETIVHRVYHLDRGYARMEQVLNRLGAKVQRVPAEHVREIAASRGPGHRLGLAASPLTQDEG